MKSSARKLTPYRKPKDRPKTSAGTRLSSPRRSLNRPPAREIVSELKEIKETLRSLVSQVYSYVNSGVCSQNASLLINQGNSVVSLGVSGGLLIDDEIGEDQGRDITKNAIEAPKSLANISDVSLTHAETSLLKKDFLSYRHLIRYIVVLFWAKALIYLEISISRDLCFPRDH